jgi:hypothetical protein
MERNIQILREMRSRKWLVGLEGPADPVGGVRISRLWVQKEIAHWNTACE